MVDPVYAVLTPKAKDRWLVNKHGCLYIERGLSVTKRRGVDDKGAN